MRGLHPSMLLPLVLLLDAVVSVEQSDESTEKHGARPAEEDMTEEPREERRQEATGGGGGGRGERRRQKRGWVIPTISIPENDRGPFPKMLVQIKSDVIGEILYSVAGSGADQDPTGVFIVDPVSGRLSVTRSLDRESIAEYQLQSYAVDSTGRSAEEPIDLVIHIIDMNDNQPKFDKPVYLGTVAEGSPPGTPVMTATASDKDDPFTASGMICYKIASQIPKTPFDRMFTINNSTGLISSIAAGLDRESVAQYMLLVEAWDHKCDPKIGLHGTATFIINIADRNDNAPKFTSSNFISWVHENAANVTVTTLTIEDQDEPGTASWRACYVIYDGDPEKRFAVETDPDTNDGTLLVVKPLNFEEYKSYNLVVVVDNEVPLENSRIGAASTATVIVIVEDVNEGPVFEPIRREVALPEGGPVGHLATVMVAHDPDMAQRQIVRYEKLSVPGNWLDIDAATGQVTTSVVLDREAALVRNNTYTATFLATDDGSPAASGTGTLALLLSDVNDNAPVLSPDEATLCDGGGRRVGLIDVGAVDADEAPNGPPFVFGLPPENPEAGANWSVQQHVDGRKARLRPKVPLPEGLYRVPLLVSDVGTPAMSALSELRVRVCECDPSGHCLVGRAAFVAASDLGVGAIVAIVMAVLLSLLLLAIPVSLLVVYKRRRHEDRVTERWLIDLKDEQRRDNLNEYDEQGGEEEDRDYDPWQLRPVCGLPPSDPLPSCASRSGDTVYIGDFIHESLLAVDNDATAPPYDSLMAFHYEGSSSAAGSLSSLDVSSGTGCEEDHDYEYVASWGQRFRKLADMYGVGHDD